MAITGPSRTEANYRKVLLDSSTSLKDFSQDRKKYFKKYILGETVGEKYDFASNMGKITETLLMEPELFDMRFHLSTCENVPTAMMADFVEALYKYTIMARDDKGNPTRSFFEVSLDAHRDSGYKITHEAVLKKFSGTDAEVYFNEILTVRDNNLIVITAGDISTGERIVEELRNNVVTAAIVNQVTNDRYTVLDQFQVQNYDIDGHKFKSMLDKVIIDHEKKTVKPYDLKCTWSVENFYEDYYLYRRAYIQAMLYYCAMKHVVEDKDSPCFGYEVEYLSFIVCDSTNYMNPLIFDMTEESMRTAYHGFVHRGKEYPGVKDIIADLSWAMEENIWNISRTNHLNKGRIQL